ncbi:hypothetical protein U1Q18_011729 [Sarracenia purpurea var. burkii]
MKVPFASTQNHHHHQSSDVEPLSLTNKPGRSNGFNGSTQTTTFCYEPKSVLDLRRSPSPRPAITDKQVTRSEASTFSDAFMRSDEPSLRWDDHMLNNFEDWDSLIRELGLHDDSAPALKSFPQFNRSDPQFPILIDSPASRSFDSTHNHHVPIGFNLSDVSSNQVLNHNSNSFGLGSDLHHMNHWNNAGFNFVDELVLAADCFESDELQHAQVILARLNQHLRSPVGNPVQRAAFYFKESLQSLLIDSTHPNRPSSTSEVVQAIKAYNNFSNVSPIVLFANFTANQAIVEAVNGTMFIHIVDFDIGFGGQWASFMKEVVDRAESRKANPPVLRISAVVPEEYEVESTLIRDNLNEFAHELKIGFEIEFVSLQSFEFLSFKAIKFLDGEKIAVQLSPRIFQRLGPKFLNDISQLSPHVVVLIDGEGLTDGGTPSFRRSVVEGLQVYSTVLETLDAANVGGSDEWIRNIETFLLRPKILAAVEAVRRRAPPWRVAFVAAGLRPVRLSQFADFQAECLLRKVQVRGFHVAKRQAELVLCWQDRPLVATSAWRC